MSSRARKKFAKQNDILSELGKSSDEDDEGVASLPSSKKKGKSLNSFDVVRYNLYIYILLCL